MVHTMQVRRRVQIVDNCRNEQETFNTTIINIVNRKNTCLEIIQEHHREIE